jgi:hypothetical protein
MQLGRFDQALAVVGKPGRQQVNDEAGLQQIEPGACGDMRYTGIIAQAAQVDELIGASGTPAHKSLEPLQVMHSGQLPQVALNIGSEVIGQCLCRIKPELISICPIEPVRAEANDIRKVYGSLVMITRSVMPVVWPSLARSYAKLSIRPTNRRIASTECWHRAVALRVRGLLEQL